MKKQNKNKLDFTKSSITELNDQRLNNVNGGSTFLCGISLSISYISVSVASILSIILPPAPTPEPDKEE